MALGATCGGIAWMMMREGLTIIVFGLGAGLAAGLLAATSLRSMLFGVPMADPATIATTAAVLATTMAAACYVPVRRAARVDPARTLTE
jgi:ABC-type antimicrobial peptide transport system permease subunit